VLLKEQREVQPCDARADDADGVHSAALPQPKVLVAMDA
jgi:hypothetical protein